MVTKSWKSNLNLLDISGYSRLNLQGKKGESEAEGGANGSQGVSRLAERWRAAEQY